MKYLAKVTSIPYDKLMNVRSENRYNTKKDLYLVCTSLDDAEFFENLNHEIATIDKRLSQYCEARED